LEPELEALPEFAFPFPEFEPEFEPELADVEDAPFVKSAGQSATMLVNGIINFW